MLGNAHQPSFILLSSTQEPQSPVQHHRNGILRPDRDAGVIVNSGRLSAQEGSEGGGTISPYYLLAGDAAYRPAVPCSVVAW